MKRTLIILFAISLVVKGYSQTTKDMAVIKQLLEKESSTWRSGDIKGHAACWFIRPYSKILISTADGTFIDVPPQLMVSPPESMVGKGGSSVNSDYVMSISTYSAWVSHKEESTDKAGVKTYSSEIRMLEKIKGQWKLVGQSIHIYKPK